jgi:hypothetical protein
MLRRCKKWDDFERKELARTDATYRDNLRIFESLWKEAIKVGALDGKDHGKHLESVLRMSRALNGLKK